MNKYLLTAIIIIAIIILLYIVLKINSKFREKAYKLFIYAENHFTEDKMDYCVEQIYNYLPVPFNFLPAVFYRWLLQKAFDEIKDLLDDGRINNSIKEEFIEYGDN